MMHKQEEIQADTLVPHAQHYAYTGELKRAIDIAQFYGFKLIPSLKVEKEDREYADKHCCPEAHLAMLRTHLAKHTSPRSKTHLITHTRKVPYKDKLELHLEVFGNKTSSAEALLMRVTHAILDEYKHPHVGVTLNSIGGRESAMSFVREVTNYYRTRLADLEDACRDEFKKNVLAPLLCTHKKCRELREDAPQSLNFLSETARDHFKEVLEYAESLELPYHVNPHLVGSQHYSTRTLFTFEPLSDDFGNPLREDEPAVLARGERYDHLSLKTGLRKTVPAINVTIDLDTSSAKEKITPKKKPIPQSPRAYVAHIGFTAKVKTLGVSEKLRKAKINVIAQIHHNTLQEQIAIAKHLETPLIVIIGQKELQDGTAIVRHTKTSEQDCIPFEKLPSYIKQKTRSYT